MDIKSLVPYDVNPLATAEKISEQKNLISRLSIKLEDQVSLTKKYKKQNDRLRQQNLDLVHALEDVEEELEGKVLSNISLKSRVEKSCPAIRKETRENGIRR